MIKYTTDRTKAIPPIFLRKCNIAITRKFTWTLDEFTCIIHTSFATTRLFFFSLRHFQHTFANVE
jgi:hypothetical protein